MIGTTIQNQPYGSIVSAGRSRVRRHVPHVLRDIRRLPSLRERVSGVLSDGRRFFVALLLLSFVLGTVICGPAAHQALESGAPSGARATEILAQKAPVEQGAPVKSRLPSLCTGHCVAHSLTLPAQFIQAVVPFVRRTNWSIIDDQWSQASRPGRLERPPRG